MGRRGCSILMLAACGCLARVHRDDVRASILQADLSTAFLRCAAGRVEKRSATEYLVFACDEVATYRCENPYYYHPTCLLDAIQTDRPRAVDRSRPAPPARPAAPAPIARPAPARPDPAAEPSAVQRAEADRLFNDGRKLAKDDRHDEACTRFAASDAIVRTYGTALNLASCALRAGDAAVAWDLYDTAARIAERDGPASLARFAHDQAAQLAPRLCTIVVTLAEPDLPGLTVRIGDRRVAPAAEIRVLVAPADVEVVVSTPGAPPMRHRVHGVAGALATVAIPARPGIRVLPARR